MSGDLKALLSQGFALSRSHPPGAAFRRFRLAALLAPGEPLAHYGCGFDLVRSGAASDARRALGRAAVTLTRRTPAAVVAETHLALALALRHLGLDAAAATENRRALAARPDDAQGWHNLANASSATRAREAAVRAAGAAVVLRPESAGMWNNLGRLRLDLGDGDGAPVAYRRALALDPQDRHAWNNLGVTCKLGNAIPSAVTMFRRQVLVHDRAAEAWANLGRNLLLSGRLEDGWAALEHNRRAAGFRPPGLGFAVPEWDGQPLDGGALLIWCEDKIGDEILFGSLLEEARARAGKLIFLCNPRLVGLWGRSLATVDVRPWEEGGVPPVAAGEVAAGYPLEFVGRFLRCHMRDFPAPRRYLKPTSFTPAARTANGTALTVGLSWRSENSLVGAYKSQALASWLPLLKVPGIRFVSLQYGDTTADVAEAERLCGAHVERPDTVDQIADIDGFAAFVKTLDLVISIPNTTVHVAGAVGTRCWVLLPAGPGLSWFWFAEGDRALWYPGMTLFRQRQVGAWEPVIADAAAALARLVSERQRLPGPA